jgi:hypothetical protein
MRLIVLPSRLHAFGAYLWCALNTLVNNVKIHPKEMGREIVDYIKMAQLREQR